jgi:hypothetical protein
VERAPQQHKCRGGTDFPTWNDTSLHAHWKVQALKQQCQVQASQFKAALERLQAGFGSDSKIMDSSKSHGLFILDTFTIPSKMVIINKTMAWLDT